MEQTPETKPVLVDTQDNTPVTPKCSGKLMLTIFSCLLIVLAAALVWLWIMLQQMQASLQKDINHATKTLHSQNQAQSQLSQQLTQFNTQLQQQKTQAAQTTDQVNQLLQTAQGGSQRWKIAEIIYVVRLANLQLAVQHSVPNAMFLLKQADSQLNALHDPSLEAFHQAIIKNIADLQAVPATDISTVITQLSALHDQVPELSILVAPKPNTSITADTTHQQHKKWWQRAWDNIKASLQQLVIVRHQHEDIPAIMAPDQQYYLQENLQLLLIQAQWAVLNHQPAVYQHSLKTAQTWVEKYYVQNSATTQAFLKQLQTLLITDVAPKLPDLTSTLALINQEAA